MRGATSTANQLAVVATLIEVLTTTIGNLVTLLALPKVELLT